MHRSILAPVRVAAKPSTVTADLYRAFHDYFVTHLPSSSLHPDSRSGPHHQLPRSSSKPHDSKSGPSPAPLLGASRDTTVVRIPLRSAKHHFGVSVSRGTRPYNEDTYQAGVIDLPAFAKRAPVNLTRAPASSPLQAYREKQKQGSSGGEGDADSNATSADGASGDPQVFYFGVFDGHGGAECSGYLREKLHGSIEATAKKYGLQSTIRGTNGNMGSPQDAALHGKTPTTPNDEKGGGMSAKKLQDTLMNSWKENVGGYFRRFKPVAFAQPSESSKPTMLTILTDAFLSTDLAFMMTQLSRSKADSDQIAADQKHKEKHSLHTKLKKNKSPPFKGGSTASVALISTPSPTPFWHPSTPSTLYTAHCGDTRILLSNVHSGDAEPLTTNHHPSHPIESSRLRRYAASFVTDSFGEERMSGLANTRAFGDMGSKRMGVSAEPEIVRKDLKPAEYAFMVIMSDGVSGCVGDQEVVDLVKEAKTPEEGARSIVGFATSISEDGHNATALVVRLGGWERRNEGGKGSLGTREEREWRRKEAEDRGGRRT